MDRTQIALRLPTDLLASIDQAAKVAEQSRAGFVRLAVRRELERRERDQAIARDAKGAS
jgi:metal-responsive CopG/Arc/MetJ family transcriptional regulator